ncbi:MAG: N-methyl-D-aspartate receptor NMDAR2C subunit [Pseudomonadota bacterium]|nr:N-methyl-D-aspartate receptor NMDAR2C subunit [Pseudomonadota bacterium]
MASDDAALARLLASYAEPARHYHTRQHLAECLGLVDELAHLAARPGEMAVALWYHDAVYVPLAHDNEARSAAWAGAALRAAGADDAVIARVEKHIMATTHHDAAGDGDARMVVDIDLAILGASPRRFAEYERQVRAEYAAVPSAEYRQKRRAVLARFLARPTLYATPALRDRLERRARLNLQKAIRQTSPQ